MRPSPLLGVGAGVGVALGAAAGAARGSSRSGRWRSWRRGRSRRFVLGHDRRAPAHGAEQGKNCQRAFSSWFSSERFRPGLAGADADDLLQIEDEDLAVPDFSRVWPIFLMASIA